jgi:zinc transporter 2
MAQTTMDYSKPNCQTSKCNLDDLDNHKLEEDDRTKSSRKLIRAVVFCVVFMIVEVIGGTLSNSLAILTNAAHLLSDIAGFAIAIFAIGHPDGKPLHTKVLVFIKVSN